MSIPWWAWILIIFGIAVAVAAIVVLRGLNNMGRRGRW